MLKRLKSSAGFTLSETLMTVLILLMVSSVVAGGVPSAVRAFIKAVDAANAHALLSTTVNALRNKLSTAWDVQVEDGVVTFIDSDTGARAKIYKKTGDGSVMVQDLPFEGEAFTGGTEVPPYELVTKQAATKKLRVTYTGVSWADTGKTVLCFTGLKVTKDGSEHEITGIEKLYIRQLTTKLAMPGGA